MPDEQRSSGGKRPRLSMAMMVRDEEEFLEDALKSAAPFVDEMVVVDTGSTDRTIEIARDLGATVSEVPWSDSFSAARNATLQAATGRWVLILDADERLVGSDPEHLRRGLPDAGVYPFQVFMLDVVNTTLAGEVLSSAYSVRIIPNDRRLGYAGRVHNNFCALDPSFPEVRASYVDTLKITHLGYDPTIYKRREKAKRSLPLIEASVRDDPTDLAQRYYLGREYLRVQRLDDAIRSLEEAIAMMQAAAEPPNLLEAAWRDLIEAKRADQRPLADVLKSAITALEVFPQNADLWFVTARVLESHAQNTKAVEFYRKALGVIDAGTTDYQRWSVIAHRAWEIHERIGHNLADAGQLAGGYAALLEAVDCKPVDAGGWPELLNVACALAIDVDDDARLPDLLDRLLSRPDTPVAMLFVEVDRRARREGAAAAAAYLETMAARYPRIKDTPQYRGRSAT